jgi:glycerol-3-phosphate acyltransferase PlsY
MEEILVVGLGYLAGSLPFAFLLARQQGVDLRHVGSGNVGAANVLRTSGLPRALAAISLDAAKGAVAVLVAERLAGGPATPVAAGLASVIGHIYPVWLGFRGGKGVATAAGVFAILAPVASAIACIVFVVAIWVTRYISVGSMAAAVALAVAVAAGAVEAPAAVSVGAAVAAIIIVHRHRANLERLVAGTERRVGQRL